LRDGELVIWGISVDATG